MTPMIKRTLTLIIITLFLGLFRISARPEIIVEGTIYYSNEIEEDAEIKELVGEKNYEEVYRDYTYYEAVYDEQKRLVLIKEFERGELVWSEKYIYDEGGQLEKSVQIK